MYLLLTALFSISYAKPLSSCDSQIDCLDIEVTEQETLDAEGKKQYEMCLFWSTDLEDCQKDDEISHACPSQIGIVSPDFESSKIEGWGQGRDNAMCSIVSCDGDAAVFAIKDGKECANGGVLVDFSLSNYTQMVTCYDGEGADCGKGNSKACRWIIPAPDCEEEDTSQPTEEPGASCNCNVEADINACMILLDCYMSDACYCHDCDCDAIDTMNTDLIGSPEQRAAVCNEGCAGDCYTDNTEGAECIATESVPPENLYVRNRETGSNSNINFVVDEDEAAKHAVNSAKNSVWFIALGLLIVLIAVIVGAYFFWRKRKVNAKFEVPQDDIEEEVEVETH